MQHSSCLIQTHQARWVLKNLRRFSRLYSILSKVWWTLKVQTLHQKMNSINKSILSVFLWSLLKNALKIFRCQSHRKLITKCFCNGLQAWVFMMTMSCNYSISQLHHQNLLFRRKSLKIQLSGAKSLCRSMNSLIVLMTCVQRHKLQT